MQRNAKSRMAARRGMPAIAIRDCGFVTYGMMSLVRSTLP